MQHIEDKMKKSSLHSPAFVNNQYVDADYRMYDDAWKSEESDAISLPEVPLDYLDSERSDCEDTVNNAITEVSNDFLSGKMVNFGHRKYGDSDESHSDAEFKLLSGLAYVARYPETAVGMSDNDWNPYGTESDSNISPRISSHDGSGPALSDSRLSSLTLFNPPLHSTDLNMNTPSAMICSIPDHETRLTNINEQTESDTAFILEPDISANFSSMSKVSEQTRSLHRPLVELQLRHDLNRTMRGPELEASSAKSMTQVHENVAAFNTSDEEKLDDNRDRMSKKYSPLHEVDSFLVGESHRRRVQTTFSGTEHLEKTFINMRSHKVVDYKLIQQDLQEIQDSLQCTHVPEVNRGITGQASRAETQSRVKTPVSLDSDHDIIPSTTTTPDGQNKMAWDFAADLGYQQSGDLMCDISLETFTTNSHRQFDDKKSYNSDGDETRTSGSSDKIVDHVAADQVLTEMSQILHPHPIDHTSFRDVDQMLFNFRNQRQQIESRYEQLNNQGLAEKVYRILSNQDPQSQANEILSEITLQENGMKDQISSYKDFNFSAVSSQMDETSQSLALLDNVRKRLDMSGLSSAEISKLTDRSSVNVPIGKGFTTFDGMAKLLTSQMAKALERTFNHSLEMVVPQRIIHCYPLTVDNKLPESIGKERFDEEESKRVSSQPAESFVTSRLNEDRLIENSEEEQQQGRGRKIGTETIRPAPTSGVIGLYTGRNDQNQNSGHSHEDSDSSSSRRREKYRPYRPPGSREVYYTESDVASVAESVTTMESTHIGSDDARGPVLPASVLGTRQDAPNSVGIYGSRIPLFSHEGDVLPSIQEKSGLQDERETESNQSYKGDKTLESLRSQSKERGGSSCGTDRGSIVETQQEDSSVPPRVDRTTEGRHAHSREEVASLNVRSEFSDLRSEVGGAAARNNSRWANFRTQQEQQIIAGSTNINHNTRIHESERSGRKDHLPQQSRVDEFRPTVRQNEQQLPTDYFRRPTDMLFGSEYPGSSQTDKFIEPISLRNRGTHDDDDNETLHRYSYTQDESNKERMSHSAGNIAVPSTSRFYPEKTYRSFRSRFGDAEKPFSPSDTHSLPRESYSSLTLGTIPRSHSDEDLDVPVRGAHISPLFHRALSPELRHSIGSRSPILSRHIEQSLRQPPAERLNYRPRDVYTNPSPPPTLFARERSQDQRVYTPNLRRSPSTPGGANLDRPWSPVLQARVVSPSPNQDDLKRASHSLNPPDRQMVTLRGVSSESDETDPDRRPVSRRAQLLTQALTQEKDLDIQLNIGSLWEQFKANNESYESSLNTSSLEAVTDLLLNPSPHLIGQCLKETEEHIIERQDRAEAEREKRRTEQQRRAHQTSSEEELIVGYAELLAQKEAERMKRRMARKKKGKFTGPANAKSEVSSAENIPDNLFSIPEDASFEQSPSKLSLALKPQRSKLSHKPHVIDPNMEKLRNRISNQRQKIDKHTLKEIQRIEKLKKLEQLLSAKRNGEISDQTLEMQLNEMSSTSTPGSDNSQDGCDKHAESHNSTPLSDDSTTVKDSSTEMHTGKAEKQARMKEAKSTEMKQIDKHMSIKTGQDRSSSHLKGVPQEVGTRKSEVIISQSKLLKLVKEGYLTAEEAYRLAVEREAAEETPSLETSRGSSSDEIYGNHSNRLHKLYSPYARDENLLTHMSHYVPKLKFAPSASDVTHSKSRNKYNSERNGKKLSTVSDHNDSHASNHNTGHGYIRPKVSLMDHSDSRWRERSAPSGSRSAWQEERKSRGSTPSRSLSQRASSAISCDKQTSLNRSSPSRRGHRVSPTRACSISPRNKVNAKKHRPSNKQATHPSARNEKTYRSENDPPFRKKPPERGGVTWHIPMDKLKMPKTRQELPLQERKLITNTSSKKTADRSLQIEDAEPLQGWQNDRREVDNEIWHKTDHPQGIPTELWEHIVRNDALATKVNHWEVDPLMDRVQYILNKHLGDSGTEDEKGNSSNKHLSLQEAFLARKQIFISKCKERQKRLALSCEHRKLQECLRLEREALFMDQERMTQANINAHPYSDNLYHPKRRNFSKHEMKELTMKRYKKLPEVLEKQESDKRREQCKLNRLRVSIFNRKVQMEALRKKSM